MLFLAILRNGDLIRKLLFDFVISLVLSLFVTFVAHQDKSEGRRAVCFGLFKPFCDVNKTVSVADIVDDNGSDCVTVVSSCDGFETLLSGLNS